MLKPEIKDVQFCAQGKHIVPRDEMTKMLLDNGKGWRLVCKDCKEEILKLRKQGAARKSAGSGVRVA